MPDLTTAEVDFVTRKVACLSVVTSELSEDSSPEAIAEVGRGLARDIARKVDAAILSDGTVNGGEQPDGLASLTVGAGAVQDVAAGTTPADLDAFAEAQMLAANVGAQITTFVTNPVTALVLANMKEVTGSGKPLLQPDPIQPTYRMIFGVPGLTSPEATVGTIWGLPASEWSPPSGGTPTSPPNARCSSPATGSPCAPPVGSDSARSPRLLPPADQPVGVASGMSRSSSS